MYKKVFLAILFMIVPLLCFSLNEKQSIKVISYLPSLNQKWLFAGDALYFRPNSTDSTSNTFNPTFDWGFRLNGKYFVDDAKGISVIWTQLDMSEQGVQHHHIARLGEGPVPIRFNYNNNLTILNVLLEESVSFSPPFELTFFGGLEYFDLKVFGNFNITSNQTQSTSRALMRFNYSGAGPHIGLKAAYGLTTHFTFQARGTIASLVSRSGDWLTDNESVDNRYPPPVINKTIHNTKQKGPVGSESMDVGVTYQLHQIDSNLSLNAGWFGIAFNIYNTRWESFYFGMKWHGNI